MPRKQPLERVYIELLAKVKQRGGSINIRQIPSQTEREFLIRLRMNGFLTEDRQVYTLTPKGIEAAQAYKPPPKDVPDHIP